jgi:hypothetical protein
MKLWLSFYLLSLLLLTSCGSDREGFVYHRQETLRCDWNSCSNERVYCQIVTRYQLNCEIIVIGEKDE